MTEYIDNTLAAFLKELQRTRKEFQDSVKDCEFEGYLDIQQYSFVFRYGEFRGNVCAYLMGFMCRGHYNITESLTRFHFTQTGSLMNMDLMYMSLPR